MGEKEIDGGTQVRLRRFRPVLLVEPHGVDHLRLVITVL
jgi:hypothetical protein